MFMPRRLPAIATLAVTLLATGAGQAAADCQPAEPIREAIPRAEVVFVGTAAEVVGSMARFEVHEVWAGTVGPAVEVHGLTSGVEFSEDDRPWEAGTRYLVVPIVEGPVLRDSICTATTEWSADLEALRPANARTVSGEEAGGATLPAELILFATVVLVVAGASVLAFRRR